MVTNQDMAETLYFATKLLADLGWKVGNQTELNGPICLARALELATYQKSTIKNPLFTMTREYLITRLGLVDESLAEWNDKQTDRESVLYQLRTAIQALSAEGATV